MKLHGWIEKDGEIIDSSNLKSLLGKDYSQLRDCGGEFYLEWDDCAARDHFGIMPGKCPPGVIMCASKVTGTINPNPPAVPLEDAILKAVSLRADKGVVAFSGGVDSALIAKLSNRPCVTVGLENSHDLIHAKEVAAGIGLTDTNFVEIKKDEIEPAIKKVIKVIPNKTPVDVSIATTMYFITRWAHINGFERVIAGQGADELFGGYARYLETDSIRDTLRKDFESLSVQSMREQAVAGMNGTYISCPYMDIRVVRAAREIPTSEIVKSGIRKYPLRCVAARHMPDDFAFYGKKAMQYGSGIWKEIQKLARQNGYKNSVQRYIDQLI
ncbi:asparagine synthase [Methanoplanus sp. FWC-SCC4]|uniref:Asparagine synthase n=1 Tax=Methanochimaera problematica TaxID=2609417 RepID=A0AA97FE56_9EURY|nr:asparagine synthase C-terminal domain-containing protein [Methanoplanus sp. FWC-SCC4]WOF17289.1 asparagine synthase [Methanoplanus sp. FWC-SCC4]